MSILSLRSKVMETCGNYMSGFLNISASGPSTDTETHPMNNGCPQSSRLIQLKLLDKQADTMESSCCKKLFHVLCSHILPKPIITYHSSEQCGECVNCHPVLE